MSRCYLLVFVLASCFLLGCNRTSGTTAGNVAVVDLDEVARQLGLSEQWSAALSAKQSTVNQKLAGYQQLLNDQLQQKRSEVVTAGGSLPAEEETQLVSYQQELNGKLRRAQAEAKKHLTDQRNLIIQDFRRQAEQASTEIARQRGYDVVLTRNESVVLTFAPAADITQDVAARLQTQLAHRKQLPAASQPRQ